MRLMRRVLLLVLLATACSSGGSADHTATVTKADLGDQWPLTVDHGELECQDPGSVLFTSPDGQVYAVNGTAKDHTDAADITAIWADADYGLKVDIGPLLDRGRALC